MAIDPVSLAITAAMTAINMAVSASKTIEGPRLKDTSATVADYGTPLNYFIGTRVLPCPSFFAKPIREAKKKRKGKGGKQVTYSGFGTWASHVADHSMTGVLKIWFDNHLVFDATGSSEKIYPLGDDYELAANMRFYYGGDEQEPDPDMLAYIEARDGPGTCPAYRPTSYIYFENIPLEMIGNRFPAVAVLVENIPDFTPPLSCDGLWLTTGEQPWDYWHDGEFTPQDPIPSWEPVFDGWDFEIWVEVRVSVEGGYPDCPGEFNCGYFADGGTLRIDGPDPLDFGSPLAIVPFGLGEADYRNTGPGNFWSIQSAETDPDAGQLGNTNSVIIGRRTTIADRTPGAGVGDGTELWGLEVQLNGPEWSEGVTSPYEMRCFIRRWDRQCSEIKNFMDNEIVDGAPHTLGPLPVSNTDTWEEVAPPVPFKQLTAFIIHGLPHTDPGEIGPQGHTLYCVGDASVIEDNYPDLYAMCTVIQDGYTAGDLLNQNEWFPDGVAYDDPIGELEDALQDPANFTPDTAAEYWALSKYYTTNVHSRWWAPADGWPEEPTPPPIWANGCWTPDGGTGCNAAFSAANMLAGYPLTPDVDTTSYPWGSGVGAITQVGGLFWRVDVLEGEGEVSDPPPDPGTYSPFGSGVNMPIIQSQAWITYIFTERL